MTSWSSASQALVLSSGGAEGAYEVGVKALLSGKSATDQLRSTQRSLRHLD